MDAKLNKILCSPDFEAWRATLWKEISQQAIQHGWVSREDIRQHDGVINPDSERWSQLYARLVCGETMHHAVQLLYNILRLTRLGHELGRDKISVSLPGFEICACEVFAQSTEDAEEG
jgi:hypothetical protein